MPLNPSAILVSDPSRAQALFPDMPCRHCTGGQVQRYETRDCERCATGIAGAVLKTNERAAPIGTPEAELTPCPDCSPRPNERGTGKRSFPVQTACPRCGGRAIHSRIKGSRPTTLNAIKPGDWVVIAVEFPALPIEDLPETAGKFTNASAELVSCMVIREVPGRAITHVRVMQTPEYAKGHGLKYGDGLQIGPNHIMEHSQATLEEFERAKAGGLFETTPVQTIPPEAGKEYFTRNGERVKCWTVRIDQSGQHGLGGGNGTGEIEWHMDGTERKGRRDYDLIGFTQVVNVMPEKK